VSDFGLGVFVRIVSKDQFNGRTGEVVEVPGFPWRDHRRIRFDPQHEKKRVHPERDTLIEVKALRAVGKRERPLPIGQLALFEVAA
jgi:hypothetical protein